MGSGFWATSIKNTGNAVAVQERDSGGQRMRQSCGRALFSTRLHKKKVKVQFTVTTSVVEPQMMTVAPLYQDWGIFPVRCKWVSYLHIIASIYISAKQTKIIKTMS